MGRQVDLDDLLEAAQVAELLGLSRATAVSVYQGRYDDFPEPVLSSASGRCQFWLRHDVAKWLQRRAESETQ